jgi:hypothetical protein
MFDEIEKAITEVQQPRSRFQIERFVIGQHQTPEMQYYQVCLELDGAIYNYKLTEIQLKKGQLKIDKLRKSGDEIKELKAQEIELGLKRTKSVMLGAERELTALIDLWNEFPHKYSRQEIEDAQPDYWKARLTGNAKAMLLGGNSVGYAHIEAMEQAGVLNELIADVLESKKELGL